MSALWQEPRSDRNALSAEEGAEDSALIQKYLESRDEILFKALVERYQERVFRLVLSVLGPYAQAEAQDVAQDVFVRVYRQLPNFRGECAFVTWVYRIAYNQALTHKQRARARMPHVPIDAPAAQALFAGEADPYVHAAQTERRAQVLACMERLPEVYRTTLNLFYWMERSVEEISAYLGAPAGTVKSYLHRGRQKLYEELKKQGWRDEDGLP